MRINRPARGRGLLLGPLFTDAGGSLFVFQNEDRDLRY